MTSIPTMTQFRVEIDADDIVHLIFDCPGRTMNVFSNAAIDDIGAFAGWLADAQVRGVVIRSGKANAFCAGADLAELGVAYDDIISSPPHRRFDHAFDHFFRLSLALRALETAGKPVAAAIAGLALGGGCELALAAHYRVLTNASGVGIGLPESLVGLLPGAGGTQRLPRLIGVAAALPVLLQGQRLEGLVARDVGIVDVLAPSGEEVAAALDWLRGDARAVQPWDDDSWQPLPPCEVSAAIAETRARVTAAGRGNYPAPIAILDCVEFGLPQVFDGAIRTEMAIFAHLIQREEPRNMIRTMFLAKTEYDRLKRKDALPAALIAGTEAVGAALAPLANDARLARAGFGLAGVADHDRPRRGLWLDQTEARAARAELTRVTAEVVAIAHDWPEAERQLLDYVAVAHLDFPAYLGGPLAWHARQASR